MKPPIKKPQIFHRFVIGSVIMSMFWQWLILPSLAYAQENLPIALPSVGSASELVYPSVGGPVPLEALNAGQGLLGSFSGVAGAALGVLGGGAGLVVPVLDAPNLKVNAVTAGSTASLKAKSAADAIATAILKTAIAMTRDMVIRWIITGRFEGPVFSQSFAIDSARMAENASRIFLSKLTRINFCAGLPPIPPQAFFGLDANLALACTFYGDLTEFRLGRVADYVSLASSEQSTNEFWNLTMRGLDQKLQYEEIARTAFGEEYRAGQGFLCIRDPQTGKCTTPGSAVAEQVIGSLIKGPREEVGVASTVQQAIAAIIDTAVRVILERGLIGAFESSP